MTGERAEERYYELYERILKEHIGDYSRPYSRPVVQKEIRRQAWAKLVSEIESEVIARTLLPTIESDAMPVRNCIQCGTFRTNHDVAQCEKDGCPLRTAPAEDLGAQITHYDLEREIAREPVAEPGGPAIEGDEVPPALEKAFQEAQPKRRGRPKKKP